MAPKPGLALSEAKAIRCPSGDQAGESSLASLERRGVRIISGIRAPSVAEKTVQLEDGSSLPYDLTFIASGVKPNPLFLNSPVSTDDDGGLLVNDHLQSIDYPEIFGGGDCISLSGRRLARVGVYAVRQNPVLCRNLLAALDGAPLDTFKPGSAAFLLILNMSDGTAILRKGGWVTRGRWAFRLKDFIDRRFMKKFQVSGELGEPLGDI